MTQRGTITERGPDRHQLRWRVNGKQLTETFHGTKPQAKRRLRDIITGLGVKAPPMTLTEWASPYLASYVVGKRPATIDRYRQHLDRVCSVLGDTRLRDLTPDMIQRLYAGLIADGLTVRTANAIIGTLSRALTKAVTACKLINNPADDIAMGKPEDCRADALDRDQLKTLLDGLRADSGGDSPERRFMYPMVMLAAMTGMRRGEIIGLTWADFNRANGTIRITGAKTSAGNRTIKLDEPTAAMMRSLQAQQAILDPTAPVFPGVRPTRLSERFSALAQRFSMPDGCTFHWLRHTHATILLSSGVPVAAVSMRLGHKDPSITYRVYAHALDGDDDAAAQAMSAALGG